MEELLKAQLSIRGVLSGPQLADAPRGKANATRGPMRVDGTRRAIPAPSHVEPTVDRLVADRNGVGLNDREQAAR